jgi:hypothetical protein
MGSGRGVFKRVPEAELEGGDRKKQAEADGVQKNLTAAVMARSIAYTT